MSINLQTGTNRIDQHTDTRGKTLYELTKTQRSGGLLHVGARETEKKNKKGQGEDLFHRSSNEVLVDEVQKASRVDLRPYCRDAIGVRARQFRFRHMRALLLHPVIGQNVD